MGGNGNGRKRKALPPPGPEVPIRWDLMSPDERKRFLCQSCAVAGSHPLDEKDLTFIVRINMGASLTAAFLDAYGYKPASGEQLDRFRRISKAYPSFFVGAKAQQERVSRFLARNGVLEQLESPDPELRDRGIHNARGMYGLDQARRLEVVRDTDLEEDEEGDDSDGVYGSD